jgi:hypothetical protein
VSGNVIGEGKRNVVAAANATFWTKTSKGENENPGKKVEERIFSWGRKRMIRLNRGKGRKELRCNNDSRQDTAQKIESFKQALKKIMGSTRPVGRRNIVNNSINMAKVGEQENASYTTTTVQQQQRQKRAVKMLNFSMTAAV